MIKVICIITPFVYTQIFYILEQNTNEILETVSFTNENLLEKINYILTKYKNIKDINIYGNVAYNEQLKKQISEFELNKFNINKIQINLIER